MYLILRLSQGMSMASSKVLRTGSSYTNPAPYTKWPNGWNGMIVRTILALEANKHPLVPLQHLRGGASNHSGVVSRYQVPDPSTIHHVRLHPSGRASKATKDDNRVTNHSKIMLSSLGSAIFVVGLAIRPRNARRGLDNKTAEVTSSVEMYITLCSQPLTRRSRETNEGAIQGASH